MARSLIGEGFSLLRVRDGIVSHQDFRSARSVEKKAKPYNLFLAAGRNG